MELRALIHCNSRLEDGVKIILHRQLMHLRDVFLTFERNVRDFRVDHAQGNASHELLNAANNTAAP